MKAEDFAAWLAAISGMSEGQRAEAMAALEKASVVGGAAGLRRSRAEARPPRGRARNDRRRARRGSGLSPLRGPRGRRLGPLAWAFAVSLQELRAHFQCADQDADGASAQEGQMARSRARDDRGQEPGEDRGALRRPSDDGLPLASSVSARPCQRQAPSLRGIVEADETFILKSFKGRWSDLPRKARKARRNGQAPGPLSGQHSRPCRPRPERRHLRRGPAPGRRRFGGPPSPESSRRAIISSAMAARRSPLSPAEPGFLSTPCRRRESPPPRRRTCTSTTSTPITAVSSNGSTASTASPPRTCPTISDGGAPSKPGATNSNPQPGSKALSATAHTNRYRYKSRRCFYEFPQPIYWQPGPAIVRGQEAALRKRAAVFVVENPAPFKDLFPVFGTGGSWPWRPLGRDFPLNGAQGRPGLPRYVWYRLQAWIICRRGSPFRDPPNIPGPAAINESFYGADDGAAHLALSTVLGMPRVRADEATQRAAFVEPMKRRALLLRPSQPIDARRRGLLQSEEPR